MSEASREALGVIDEVAWGTTPASALAEIRYTNHHFRPIIEKGEDPDVISDAQLGGLVRTGEAAQGDLAFSLRYGGHDPQWAGLFRTAWPAAATITGTTISASSVDNSFNDSANGFLTAGFRVGQFVNSNVTGNLGYAYITSLTAGKMIVKGMTLVTQAAGTSFTIKGTMITNGSTFVSHTFERKVTNSAAAVHYFAHKGMVAGGGTMDLSPGQAAIPCSMTFLGKQAVPGSATAGSGAYTAAATTRAMNTRGNVKVLMEADTDITLTSLRLAFDNGLRRREAIKAIGPTSIGRGDFRVTGSIGLYLEDRALIEKAIADTLSSLYVLMADAAGNAYGLSLFQIDYGQPDMPNQGKNTDLSVTLPFTAVKHATIGYTAGLTRIPAA
jgi:hypothetical protein